MNKSIVRGFERQIKLFLYVSNRKKISDDGWWIVQTIVLPWSANFLIACTKINAIDESKPDVGSSQKSNGGSLRICTKQTIHIDCFI